jgi:hypothetical protein
MSFDRMKLHSRAELETYVATLEEARVELEAFMKRELDVGPESLDTLEAFLLARYPTVDAAFTLDQRGVLDAAARHVGVVLLLSVPGARWDLDLEDERNVYYRLPILTLPDGAQECPLTLVTASLDRRTGTYISGVLRAYEEDYAPAKAPARAKRKTTTKPAAKPRARR